MERKIGDVCEPCPHCGGPRTWQKAKKHSWRRYCSPCHTKAGVATRRKRLTDYNKQISERRQCSISFRAYELFKAARDRARIRGLEFTLERDVVEKALAAGVCQVTGLSLTLKFTNKKPGPLSPSIDRKRPELGYTNENSQLVCWLYNRAKGSNTHEDVIILAKAILKI